MKVSIDRDKCVGAGQCVRVASAVFDQDQDHGLVLLIDATPAVGLAAFVRRAALLCPAQAIRIEGDNGGQ